MSRRYDDLISQSRPVSKKHPPMTMNNRAAQFLPFSALSGLDGALAETARETLPRIELSADELAELDARLRALAEFDRPEATLTVFIPDASKDGGAYVPIACTIKRIDPDSRAVFLTNGQSIPMRDIYAVDSDVLPKVITTR